MGLSFGRCTAGGRREGGNENDNPPSPAAGQLAAAPPPDPTRCSAGFHVRLFSRHFAVSDPVDRGAMLVAVGTGLSEAGSLAADLLIPCRAVKRVWDHVYADPPRTWYQVLAWDKRGDVMQQLHRDPLPRAMRRLSVRFAVLSDTHCRHDGVQIPPADVLLHCGDFTNHGTPQEIRAFNAWLGRLPYREKFVIPGNHDMFFDEQFWDRNWYDWAEEYDDPKDGAARRLITNGQVLMDETVEVGGVSVHGAQHIPVGTGGYACGHYLAPAAIAERWARVPRADVLATHCPPHGILDRELNVAEHIGCPELRREVLSRIRPRFHVFGHVHSDYGCERHGETTFINAACVSDFHRVRGDGAVTFDVPIPGADDGAAADASAGSCGLTSERSSAASASSSPTDDAAGWATPPARAASPASAAASAASAPPRTLRRKLSSQGFTMLQPPTSAVTVP